MFTMALYYYDLTLIWFDLIQLESSSEDFVPIINNYVTGIIENCEGVDG